MSGLRVALAYLTRLPLGGPVRPGRDDLVRAAPWFGAVGIGLGVAVGSWFWFASVNRGFGLPATVAVGTLAAAALFSGARNEVGLAASVDALVGGWTPEERLRRLRDGRLEARGALALVLVTLLKWSTLLKVGSAENGLTGFATLVAALGVGHALAGGALVAVPEARADGRARLGAGFGPLVVVAVTAAIAVVPLGLAPGGGVPIAVAVLGVSVGVCAMVLVWGQRLIGGQTPELVGAVQQLVELAALVTVARSL